MTVHSLERTIGLTSPPGRHSVWEMLTVSNSLYITPSGAIMANSADGH